MKEPVLIPAKMTNCPSFLNTSFKMLHSDKEINLCKLYNEGKPVLFVNTASHCGYTKQFKNLERIYQTYKKQGLQVIGFASNSFHQEDSSEAKAAEICYKNYGVTFTMLAPTPVKGDNANPVFKYLSEHSQEPSWNFNKYLLQTHNGAMKVTHFKSAKKPEKIKFEF